MIHRTILLALHSSGVLHADSRPNILLMFADDPGRCASAYAAPREPSPNDIIKTCPCPN